MFTEKFLDSIKTDIMSGSMNDLSEVNFGNLMQKPNAVITDLGKSLLQAAKHGNTDKVHELMSRGAPFTTDWLGTSPLHLAARNNHIETCQVLLRAGISRDSKTKVDRTPLHFAVYQGNEEIVTFLLNNKCDVDARDMLKMTALHWAVEKRHDKIVEMLLQHGSDPNAMSKFGKTPINIATESGQVDIVRILMLANQLRAREQVKEATDNLMQELQQQQGKVEETEDNITMDLSNDGSFSNLSSQKDDHVDTDNLIEREDSLSDAIINLQSSADDTRNLDTSTLQMLKEHGISMIPSDDSGSSLITSALQSGRKIILSEAGKFALNETRVVKKALTPTIKIIKKASAYTPPQQSGGIASIKTNKVIKILSAEEFKQICGGEIGGMKKISTLDYKKSLPNGNFKVHQALKSPNIISTTSNNNRNIKKIVMTKNRGTSNEIISIKSNLNNNRHIVTSADGIKRIRTSTGLEIISKLPTKLAQDTTVTHDSNQTNNSRSNTTDLERQFLEMKKQTDELRKQFELSQKQIAEYRMRLEKLEKEVQSLKENNPNNFIELSS